MKSNVQLHRDDSNDEVPPPVAMRVSFPDMASSSQTILPSELEVNYAQIMEALVALQGGMSNMLVTMSSMQQSITSMQLEVHSINLHVEQNQLDLQKCLKYHHPGSSDDEDDAASTAPLPEDV
jgi:hypothetical protein